MRPFLFAAIVLALGAGCDYPPNTNRMDTGVRDIGSDIQDAGIDTPDVPIVPDVPDDVPEDTVMVDVGCSPLAECNGMCVDTNTNRFNCGMCGRQCNTAGSRCMNGNCVCDPGFCSDGMGGCVLLNTNDNCGTCGNRCTLGRICTGATCQCPPGRCFRDNVGCIDPLHDSTYCSTDPVIAGQNCSNTFTSCLATQYCNEGTCDGNCMTFPNQLCTDTGQTLCVNTQTNPRHCGTCNNVCPTGQTCQSGGCACQLGQSLCGATCVPLTTDTNCGACGTTCTNGKHCRANGLGGYACSCAPDEYNCAGTCVAKGTATNCAGCGMACNAPGVCQQTSPNIYTCGCAPGQSSCTPMGGGAAVCTNTGNDLNNCGSCGTRCPAGGTCSAGICQCPSGTVVCGASGSNPGTCVNVFGTDSNNCGACGMVCPSGQQCVNGACSCGTNLISCPVAGGGTQCVTSSASPNCGVCGRDCGSLVCALSGPTYGCQCPSGSEFCGVNSCVPTTQFQTSNTHCGGCNRACTGTGRTCMGGSCVCNPATHYDCGGVCIAKQSNQACSACGDVCPANSNCQVGACTCSAGFNRCPVAGTPFSCVNFNTDRANCGGCGRACSTIATSCTNGTCVCPAGTTLNTTTLACECPIAAQTYNATTGMCECPLNTRVCTNLNQCRPNNQCCRSSDCSGGRGCCSTGACEFGC